MNGSICLCQVIQHFLSLIHIMKNKPKLRLLLKIQNKTLNIKIWKVRKYFLISLMLNLLWTFLIRRHQLDLQINQVRELRIVFKELLVAVVLVLVLLKIIIRMIIFRIISLVGQRSKLFPSRSHRLVDMPVRQVHQNHLLVKGVEPVLRLQLLVQKVDNQAIYLELAPKSFKEAYCDSFVAQ